MMIGVGVMLGTLVTSEGTGVAAWMGIVLGPVLSSMNNTTLYIVLAVIGFVMTNLLNNNAVIVILSSTIVSMYTQGFISDPVLAIMVVIASTAFGFLTPASSMYGAMIHGQNFITGQSAYKYGMILLIFTLVAVIALLLPLASIIVQ